MLENDLQSSLHLFLTLLLSYVYLLVQKYMQPSIQQDLLQLHAYGYLIWKKWTKASFSLSTLAYWNVHLCELFHVGNTVQSAARFFLHTFANHASTSLITYRYILNLLTIPKAQGGMLLHRWLEATSELSGPKTCSTSHWFSCNFLRPEMLLSAFFHL